MKNTFPLGTKVFVITNNDIRKGTVYGYRSSLKELFNFFNIGTFRLLLNSFIDLIKLAWNKNWKIDLVSFIDLKALSLLLSKNLLKFDIKDIVSFLTLRILVAYEDDNEKIKVDSFLSSRIFNSRKEALESFYFKSISFRFPNFRLGSFDLLEPFKKLIESLYNDDFNRLIFSGFENIYIKTINLKDLTNLENNDLFIIAKILSNSKDWYLETNDNSLVIVNNIKNSKDNSEFKDRMETTNILEEKITFKSEENLVKVINYEKSSQFKLERSRKVLEDFLSYVKNDKDDIMKDYKIIKNSDTYAEELSNNYCSVIINDENFKIKENPKIEKEINNVKLLINKEDFMSILKKFFPNNSFVKKEFLFPNEERELASCFMRSDNLNIGVRKKIGVHYNPNSKYDSNYILDIDIPDLYKDLDGNYSLEVLFYIKYLDAYIFYNIGYDVSIPHNSNFTIKNYKDEYIENDDDLFLDDDIFLSINRVGLESYNYYKVTAKITCLSTGITRVLESNMLDLNENYSYDIKFKLSDSNLLGNNSFSVFIINVKVSIQDDGSEIEFGKKKIKYFLKNLDDFSQFYFSNNLLNIDTKNVSIENEMIVLNGTVDVVKLYNTNLNNIYFRLYYKNFNTYIYTKASFENSFELYKRKKLSYSIKLMKKIGSKDKLFGPVEMTLLTNYGTKNYDKEIEEISPSNYKDFESKNFSLCSSLIRENIEIEGDEVTNFSEKISVIFSRDILKYCIKKNNIAFKIEDKDLDSFVDNVIKELDNNLKNNFKNFNSTTKKFKYENIEKNDIVFMGSNTSMIRMNFGFNSSLDNTFATNYRYFCDSLEDFTYHYMRNYNFVLDNIRTKSEDELLKKEIIIFADVNIINLSIVPDRNIYDKVYFVEFPLKMPTGVIFKADILECSFQRNIEGENYSLIDLLLAESSVVYNIAYSPTSPMITSTVVPETPLDVLLFKDSVKSSELFSDYFEAKKKAKRIFCPVCQQFKDEPNKDDIVLRNTLEHLKLIGEMSRAKNVRGLGREISPSVGEILDKYVDYKETLNNNSLLFEIEEHVRPVHEVVEGYEQLNYSETNYEKSKETIREIKYEDSRSLENKFYNDTLLLKNASEIDSNTMNELQSKQDRLESQKLAILNSEELNNKFKKSINDNIGGNSTLQKTLNYINSEANSYESWIFDQINKLGLDSINLGPIANEILGDVVICSDCQKLILKKLKEAAKWAEKIFNKLTGDNLYHPLIDSQVIFKKRTYIDVKFLSNESLTVKSSKIDKPNTLQNKEFVSNTVEEEIKKIDLRLS